MLCRDIPELVEESGNLAFFAKKTHSELLHLFLVAGLRVPYLVEKGFYFLVYHIV